MNRLLVLSLLALPACGSPTGPSQPTLQFEHRVLFGIPTLPVSATGEEGVIRLSGVFQTPQSGYSLYAALTIQEPRGLKIVVEAVQNMPGFPFPSQNFYTGSILGLTAGDYELTVVHILRDAGRETTVYDKTVTVR